MSSRYKVWTVSFFLVGPRIRYRVLKKKNSCNLY